MRSPSPRSPSPNSSSTQDALLHGQFTDWSMGGSSGGSSGGNSSSADSCPSSPAGTVSLPSSPSSYTYALTLTLTDIHVQKICPRPGKEARVLLPLSELVGCNCPRAPAPPLLMLYWYPMGRRRRGVAKRRQVRAYLAESRAEAEKWNTAVQCLLRGIDISVYTERHNHARELIREISLHEWDGIIIVSGDGLLHEVINGLMDRPDWEQAIKTPVGILPCGSGNALAGSINHYAGYDMCLREPLLINCCFLLCRGGVRPMDLVSVTTSPSSSSASSNQNGQPLPPKRLFSFLSVAWGFVSDVDIESERYRGLGSARFTLGTLVRLASLRSYKGRLSYLPPGVANSTLEVPLQTPHRPLSRSITEGLEGYCRMPIHRTCSDMGLSEQRNLQKGDREREREERYRERQRRRGRGRGRRGGVVRASSLAEDREREMEAEVRMEGMSGSNAESNERLESNEEEEEEDESTRNLTEEEYDVDEEKEVEERMDRTSGSSLESSERQESANANEEGKNERWNGMDGVKDLRGDDSAHEGKEEEEEAYSNPDLRKACRKNSAPSGQITTAFFSRPIGADSEQEVETPAYDGEDEELNGTYFPRGAFSVEPARERALTISSPFRRSRFSLSKHKTVVDQNQNQKSSVYKPRPLSLLQQLNSNSLPPKLSTLAMSLSPTHPLSPSSNGPHTYLSSSTSSSSFPFELVQPGRLLKPRPLVTTPADPPPEDNLLPPLDQPIPTRDWVTIEGDFVLVLAIYQSHLGADLLAAPHAKFDDGLIHLTFVRAGISRATLLRLFLAMERGTHLSLSSPYVSHVSARAFRLQPLSPRGTLTVDGELVPYGPLQAQIHPSMARVIVGDSGVKITRF
ncbi:Sphingosine kinase 2 [Bagarius yarrelli]|uniref:sphingosine kinase n=1 Tax=Bagarius yarrelli TaxID=175774 RepID=A0A556U1J5_BAGYA|nr:Sphingosine kinase 2 [Bagarius yarrelli]